MRIEERGERRIQLLDTDGEAVSTPEQTSDLIGNAWADDVNLVVVPISRLDSRFFDLRSGFAGEFTQKLANYRLQVAIVGDISSFVAASDALRDWVWESNRGRQVWFVRDEDELWGRLGV